MRLLRDKGKGMLPTTQNCIKQQHKSACMLTIWSYQQVAVKSTGSRQHTQPAEKGVFSELCVSSKRVAIL